MHAFRTVNCILSDYLLPSLGFGMGRLWLHAIRWWWLKPVMGAASKARPTGLMLGLDLLEDAIII
jgi:hypothetical protein